MDRRHRAGSTPPFLTDEEVERFDLLGEMLAGRLLSRPDDAPPLDLPDEWVEYQLAKHMGWSSQELDDCPIWRKQQWTRFMALEQQAEAERHQQHGQRSEQQVQADQADAMTKIRAAQQAQPNFRPPEGA